MKFFVQYTTIEKKTLIYNTEECSFDTEPSAKEVNFDITINRLNLTAVDEDNKIVQLWGVSGYNEWKVMDYQVPVSKPGILRVMDNLKYGFIYQVAEEDWPVYANRETGWICFGSPEKKSNMIVEFVSNCVAVIEDGSLLALWLKPTKCKTLGS